MYSVKQAQDGSVVVTLLIDDTDAKTVAAYGAVGQLTLLQAPITDGDASVAPSASSSAQPDAATGGQG